MEPTIKGGQVVLVAQWFSRLHTGDVVVFKKGSEYWVKRVKFIRGDELVVEGDNRSDSLDSRSFGTIKVDQVIGKVILRY